MRFGSSDRPEQKRAGGGFATVLLAGLAAGGALLAFLAFVRELAAAIVSAQAWDPAAIRPLLPLTVSGAALAALTLAAIVLSVRLGRHREQTARLLTEQNKQLRAVEQAKTDFLANISHDLRTPLAHLQISISGLLDPEVSWSPDEVRETLREAAEEITQMGTKVRNLLEMSRIEAHAYPMNRQPSDLTDIVAGALEQLESVVRGRKLMTDFPPTPLLVLCDPAQIETVLINLVENAAKYSPPGSPLHLRGYLRRGSAVFTLRDEGPGIVSGDEERIFQKFYRARRDQPVAGTGLGLAI